MVRLFLAWLLSLAMLASPVLGAGSFSLMQVGSAGGAAPPISLLWALGGNSGTGSSSSITGTSGSIGAANAGRYVVAVVQWAIAGASSISSISVCGGTPTLVGHTGSTAQAALYIISCPTGTTTPFTVNFSTSVSIYVSFYALNNLLSTSPVDLQMGSAVGTLNASTSAGGAAIGAITATGGTSFTVSGTLTTDHNGASGFVLSLYNGSQLTTGATSTLTFTGGSTPWGSLLATFR